MKKIRVVLADDHTMVRKGIVSMLTGDPKFEVVGDAANGKELIDLIGHMSEPPDVCLLDINMPVMDGYKTLVILKKTYPDMRFLVLSQLDHEYVIIRMLKSGANGYLLKDAEPGELKQAIIAIIEKPFYYSELVNGHLISMVQKGEAYTKLTLTDIEQEFLKQSCSELTYKQIADKMGLGKRTVEGYRESLFQKLGVKSRTGLALYAIRLGLVPFEEGDPDKSLPI
jgi:DNA-binding NarL/FixJ family response regulator